jgi:gluconolactonase
LRTAFITLSGTGRVIAMDWPRPGAPLLYLNQDQANLPRG